MDVLEIDAASNTGVGDVRDVIISGINIKPARDRYKVFIIDEVHMLSTSAFNALLKTVEEPPPSVVFIMATTDEHKVPETITSRCQLFEFRTIAAAKIAERLKQIAKAENISIADEAIRRAMQSGAGNTPPWAWLTDLIQSVLYGGIVADPILAPVLNRIAALSADRGAGCQEGRRHRLSGPICVRRSSFPQIWKKRTRSSSTRTTCCRSGFSKEVLKRRCL